MRAGLAVGALVAGGVIAAVVVAVTEPKAAPPPPSAVQPATVVSADGGQNWGAVASNGWFAWMHGPGEPQLPPITHTVVYVRHGSGSAWRANPAGTYAQTGGITSGKLVLQLLHHSSLLATVDLRTRKLHVLRAPINDPQVVQWRPSASGHRVLYGRMGNVDFKIMLADLDTNRVVELDDVHGHAAYAEPGQLNGRYATWIACPDNKCRVYRYDIDTGQRVEMPPVGGSLYDQFGPSVTADGTVYFGITRNNCATTQLVRWRAGRVTTIYRFPPQQGFEYSYAAATRPVTIYFDDGACRFDAQTSIDAIRG